MPKPKEMDAVLSLLIDDLRVIMPDNNLHLCLYGSVAYDDYREGQSDIDIIVLTDGVITDEQAAQMLMLRQSLVKRNANPDFRKLEGIIASFQTVLQGQKGNIVYWGTSGQRIMDAFDLDCFTRMLLKEKSEMICGNDFRDELPSPSQEEILSAIAHSLRDVRNHGNGPSCIGWYSYVARGLYTLETHHVTSKTQALTWALEKGLASNPKLMEDVIALRTNPSLEGQGKYTQQWLESLAPDLQLFADVLEQKLKYQI